ncbi:MqnA/MqnD/SBP family protein [Cuniculiplasma sp. SKW4]|uniref:MqnA/MqnD/SBP family protein n=1 Tax=Cuniculiplasma sp. SKW4 TaxID=3400171 RepID=UPI003FD4C3BB
MNTFALINLIHSEPLANHLEKNFIIRRGTTRDNLKLLLSGQADYAMISIVDYFKHYNELDLVYGPTITGKIHSMSNLLISKDLDPYPGMNIAVTSETETTAFYLREIVDQMYPGTKLIRSKRSTPEELLSEEDFALVIGNNALRVYESDFRVIFDVTKMFSKIFDLYSIYAVTATKKDGGMERSLKGEFEVEEWEKTKLVEPVSSKYGISPNILANYFAAISYDFDTVIEREIKIIKEMYDEKKENIFTK